MAICKHDKASELETLLPSDMYAVDDGTGIHKRQSIIIPGEARATARPLLLFLAQQARSAAPRVLSR